jgi:predicted SprT family Zn-dependent metalloprotease
MIKKELEHVLSNKYTNKIEEKKKMLEVLFLTESLLIEHRLSSEIAFRVHDEALGVCYNNGEKISLQVNHVIFNDMESVKNTILHEIAHALVGNEQGHNEIWQATAKELGVKFNINYRK